MQKFYDLAIILIVITISVIIPIMMTKKRVKVTLWDYCFPYLGVPLWFLLRELGIGSVVNSSNFMVEMFCILVISVAVPWIRFGLTFSESQLVKKISLFLTLLPFIVAIFVRLVMPELPS